MTTFMATALSRTISGPFMQLLIAVSFILTLSACGGSGGDDGVGVDFPEVPQQDDPEVCNAATQKQWAYDGMRDFYLFYDQVPVVDPQSFDSADDLVRRVRFQERDDFSHVTNAVTSAMIFDEGRDFGLGYRWRTDREGNPRITQVVRQSPFGLAGIERGDIIFSVDGLVWSDEALDVDFGDRVFGTPDNPATAAWGFIKRDTGQFIILNITAAEYSINTVLKGSVFTSDQHNGRVGYLNFSRFLNTSEGELNSVFDFFQNRDINDLVLDLRYNGGGLVSIARQLASLIAGRSNAGNTIYDYRFNDKYPQKNYSLEFQDNVGELGLTRLIVLTSGGTASASEIVIAGLQPYLDVVTIGTTTRGKPYVQRAYDRCGERLAVIEAEGFNTAGVSVFGGVPAMCFALDDPTRDFGLGEDGRFEGMLGAAIDLIETGACATSPVVASRSLSTSGKQADARQGMSSHGGALANW